jgi:monofunctional biosynthetic peptidoglycan transglycosylase
LAWGIALEWEKHSSDTIGATDARELGAGDGLGHVRPQSALPDVGGSVAPLAALSAPTLPRLSIPSSPAQWPTWSDLVVRPTVIVPVRDCLPTVASVRTHSPDIGALGSFVPVQQLPTDSSAPSALGLPKLGPPLRRPGVLAKSRSVTVPTVWPRVRRFAGRATKWALIASVSWFAMVLGLIGLFRFVDPPASLLMVMQRLAGQPQQQDWVPLDAVSNTLRRAVLVSEDGKFCRHWGFDIGEIRAAMNSTEGFGRGASTISQQVAKNMFLWPGKSYVRKGLEIPLTLALEAIWPKWRIFEVYLNIAEWGPGVFGVEAASQNYFSISALRLNDVQSALLAVTLPNPIARDASDPSPAVSRRASHLQTRMRTAGGAGCVLTATSGRSSTN